MVPVPFQVPMLPQDVVKKTFTGLTAVGVRYACNNLLRHNDGWIAKGQRFDRHVAKSMTKMTKTSEHRKIYTCKHYSMIPVQKRTAQGSLIRAKR